MDLSSTRRALADCPCGRLHETQLPRVEIGPDITQKTAQILLAERFGQHLHLVGDRNTLAAAPALREALLSVGFILSETVFDDMYSADMPAAEQIISEAAGAEGILAIGCGSVNDLCKLAASRIGLPYAIFASAPSMDGFVSKDAAIIQDSFKGSYEACAPRLVLGDTRVLAAAPARLKASGFGDLIGKYTALADWEISHLVTGEYFCPRLAQLTRDGADRAVALADQIAGSDEQAAGALMEALVLSGIAMLYSGNSRPASGAEHHLSHFWEMLALRKGQVPGSSRTQGGRGLNYDCPAL